MNNSLTGDKFEIDMNGTGNGNDTSKGLFTILVTNILVLLACATMKHMIKPWYQQINGDDLEFIYKSHSETRRTDVGNSINSIEARGNTRPRTNSKIADIEMRLKAIHRNMHVHKRHTERDHNHNEDPRNYSNSNSQSTSMETNSCSITRFNTDDLVNIVPTNTNKEMVMVNKECPIQKVCTFRDAGYDRDNEESVVSMHSVLDTLDE